MASIGFATLEIIPSLRGVSEAIEKQIDGKVVSVTVEPKVSQPAADKAGKAARATVEKHTKDVKVEPKVDQKAAEDAGKKAGATAGKQAAKAIVDGIADGVKQELPRGGVGEAIVEGIADGVKQGIDGVGIGGQVVTTISTGIKSGNLGGAIKDAIVPAVKGIGNEIQASASAWSRNIADSLLSGDIRGATDQIGTTVRNTTDLIADIGDTFGLQLDGVRNFGDQSATTLSTFGTNVQNAINSATGLKGTLDGVGTILETVLPGKAGAGAAGIARALGSVAVPAWLMWLASDQMSKMNWGNGEPVGAIPNRNNFTPGQRSNAEILLGPFLGPAIDRALGTGGGAPELIPGGGGPNAQRQRRGYQVGGYTGRMPFDKIAGVVHGGEYVINARATAGIERSMPGLLPFLNQLPGYKPGGKVQLGNISAPGITTAEQQSMWDAIRSTFPAAILSSATRTVMTEGHPDYHNAGRAIDISGPGMGAIASWIATNYPNSLELIHSPFGHNIKNGQNVGDGTSFYGAGLMAAHRDHVHWALGSMASAVTAPDTTAATESQSLIGPAISTPSASMTPMGGDGASAPRVTLASSISRLATTGLSNVNPKTKVSDSSPERAFDIGGAATAAIGGQIQSAMGLFGISDSPGWLKGIATLANGVTVGDSITPVSSTTTATPATGGALDSVHSGTGMAPGPVTNYNIQTTDIEPAYLASERHRKEQVAAQLAHI